MSPGSSRVAHTLGGNFARGVVSPSERMSRGPQFSRRSVSPQLTSDERQSRPAPPISAALIDERAVWIKGSKFASLNTLKNQSTRNGHRRYKSTPRWVVVLGERAVEGRANRLSNYARVAGAERRPPVAFGKLMRQPRERPQHRRGRRWFVR